MVSFLTIQELIEFLPIYARSKTVRLGFDPIIRLWFRHFEAVKTACRRPRG